jgi:hypothetical protein
MKSLSVYAGIAALAFAAQASATTIAALPTEKADCAFAGRSFEGRDLGKVNDKGEKLWSVSTNASRKTLEMPEKDAKLAGLRWCINGVKPR